MADNRKLFTGYSDFFGSNHYNDKKNNGNGNDDNNIYNGSIVYERYARDNKGKIILDHKNNPTLIMDQEKACKLLIARRLLGLTWLLRESSYDGFISADYFAHPKDPENTLIQSTRFVFIPPKPEAQEDADWDYLALQAQNSQGWCCASKAAFADAALRIRKQLSAVSYVGASVSSLDPNQISTDQQLINQPESLKGLVALLRNTITKRSFNSKELITPSPKQSSIFFSGYVDIFNDDDTSVLDKRKTY